MLEQAHVPVWISHSALFLHNWQWEEQSLFTQARQEHKNITWALLKIRVYNIWSTQHRFFYINIAALQERVVTLFILCIWILREKKVSLGHLRPSSGRLTYFYRRYFSCLLIGQKGLSISAMRSKNSFCTQSWFYYKGYHKIIRDIFTAKNFNANGLWWRARSLN